VICIAHSREIALRDYLTRQFDSQREPSVNDAALVDWHLLSPGQAIIERSAVFITNEVEVRFVVGLPTFGRRIAGRAVEMLCDELPQLVERT